MKRKPDMTGKMNHTNKNGYTIIIAVIIMAVLLIIGVAVLTAAANSLNSVNQRKAGRQAYYAAKSVINVIDDSMHGGELGQYVRDKAYGQLASADDESAAVKDQALSAKAVKLGGNKELEGMSVKDLKILYDGNMSTLTESGTDRKTLSLNVKLSFTAESNGEIYKLNAAYRYDGTARLGTGGGLMWETQKWETTAISQ